MTRAEARCGTASGWARHKRQDETPCDACVTAKREYDKRWRSAPEQVKRNRLHANAQRRALKRLADLHPGLYRAFYAEERERLYREAGLPVDVVGLGNGTTKRFKGVAP